MAAAEGETSKKRAVAVVPAAVVNGASEPKRLTDQSANAARNVMEKSMEQATKTAENFFKAAEEAAEFGRGNMEAYAKMAQTLASGFQELGRQYFAVAQSLTDHTLESAKALASVKSLKEAADVQANFAKATLERTMSESAKMQEATVRLAEQAYAPLTARMTLAMERVGKPLAA